MFRWLKDISRVLLPIHCVQCKNPIAQQSELFCVSCYSQLPQTEFFKVKENECYRRFLNDGFTLNYIATLFYFDEDSPLKSAIHLLKYKGKTDIGYFFGQQLGRKINNVDLLQDVDVIIPLPLHHKKQNQRGYNQSEIIAEGISKLTNISVDNTVVKRIKNTKTQTRMNKTQRQENVMQAFKWFKTYPKGTHIMIVDDVLTTGSSIQALISSCKHQNDYKFSVICIGYTR